MESILWALDLFAVVYLCRWTLKQEKAKEKAAEGKDEGRKHA